MAKKVMLAAACSLFILNLSAQVTIGSGQPPVRAALLDIKTQAADGDNVTSKSGGLVLPRVKLTNKKTLDPFIVVTDPEWTNTTAKEKLTKAHTGLMVYNLTDTPSDPDEDKQFSPGIYTWDGTKWAQSGNTRAAGSEQNFFYMPSFNLPLSDTPPQNLSIDLYDEYVKQFNKAGNSSFISSNPAMTDIGLIARDKLDYVVTAYDSQVITDLNIDQTGATKGTLRYKVLSATAPAGSFINIVFVIL